MASLANLLSFSFNLVYFQTLWKEICSPLGQWTMARSFCLSHSSVPQSNERSLSYSSLAVHPPLFTACCKNLFSRRFALLSKLLSRSWQIFHSYWAVPWLYAQITVAQWSEGVCVWDSFTKWRVSKAVRASFSVYCLGLTKTQQELGSHV